MIGRYQLNIQILLRNVLGVVWADFNTNGIKAISKQKINKYFLI